MKELDCLFIGSSTRDIMMLVDSPPASDVRITASRFVMTFGGVSSIAGFAHHSLGGRTGIITAIGGDAAGKEIRAFQERQKPEYLQILEFPQLYSSTSLVQVEKNGKRTLTCYGGCMDAVAFDRLDREVFHHTKMVHLGVMPEDLMMAVLRYVKNETGALISVDSGNFSPELQEKILPYADIFIPDNKTVRKYLGMDEEEGCRYYVSKGVKFACVTAAEKGAYGFDGKEAFHIPAVRGKIVDTTGAGDNFHGAFLYCIGKGMNWKAAVRFASCYATLTCGMLGGPTAAPSEAEVIAGLKEEDGICL